MKWIYCTARLPEVHQKVLLVVGGRYEIGERLIGSNYFLCDTRQYDLSDVLCWRYLPDMPAPKGDYYEKWCLLKNYISTYKNTWTMSLECKYVYDKILREMIFIEKHHKLSI